MATANVNEVRQRRRRVKAPKTAPYAIRFSDVQHRQIFQAARIHGQPFATFVREAALMRMRETLKDAGIPLAASVDVEALAGEAVNG